MITERIVTSRAACQSARDMQRDDRFLLLVPLCASVVALSSLAWHSAPDVGARGASRLRHLPGGSQRGIELAAAAEGAWEAAVTESDEDWPGAGWPRSCRS